MFHTIRFFFGNFFCFVYVLLLYTNRCAGAVDIVHDEYHERHCKILFVL